MYNTTYSGVQNKAYEWKNTFASIVHIDQAIIEVQAKNIFISDLKFYNFPLNGQAIYEDLGVYHDLTGDIKFNFSEGFKDYPSETGVDVWSKLF